jgi:hypothetical protein
MRQSKLFILLAAFGCCGSAFANSTIVHPTNPAFGVTDLGFFSAGTYVLTGTGSVDLVGDGSFLINPDGTPVTTVTTPGYSYFNPSGSYLADGNYGPAAGNAKIGALIGTLDATPTSPSDWFLIGYSTTVTLSTAGDIYAAVNDTYYPNDTGYFTVNSSSVPDGGTTVALLGGALLGLHRLRRKLSV